MLVLGIETSCDETAAAVVRDGHETLASIVASQDELHSPYGGVVPEIACRAHLVTLLPVVCGALDEAGVGAGDLDAVAVARAPGLVGSLLIGLTAAKTIAWLHGLPLVGVNHLHAHTYAAALERNAPLFPCVSLVASGGHTSLFHSRTPVEHDLLGATLDDAAGEAFDKVAAILGLGYPGGPHVDRAAHTGDPRAVAFPRTRLKPGSFDFSFSGIKTAVLYHCRGQGGRGKARVLSTQEVADIAASFQEAVVDVLVEKVLAAARRTGVERITVGGGVAANTRLRDRLKHAARSEGLELALPPMRYCVDNAAMVAGIGYHLFQAGRTSALSLDADPTAQRRAPAARPDA